MKLFLKIKKKHNARIGLLISPNSGLKELYVGLIISFIFLKQIQSPNELHSQPNVSSLHFNVFIWVDLQERNIETLGRECNLTGLTGLCIHHPG